MVGRFLNDSITRGFLLTTILLLGVGLEQGLVSKNPSEPMTIWFLFGNLSGLPLGIYLWSKVYSKSLLPLYFWLLEAITVTCCAWRPIPIIFFLSGLLFGVLILHLFLLGKDKPLSGLIPRIGTGIIAGNMLLFLLEMLPWPLGLGFLAVALAGWRINRPETPPASALKRPFHLALKDAQGNGLTWLWLFFLCFYTLGGLYYSILDAPANSATLPNSAISLLIYILGILTIIILPSRYLKISPFIAVVVMGLGIIFQIASNLKSLQIYPLMGLSFGMADCLSLSIIIAFSKNLAQGALGFALYPVSIILGLLVSTDVIQAPLKGYQWTLVMLFLTIIPLSFTPRLLRKGGPKNKNVPILALPPPFPDTKDQAATVTSSKDTCKPDEPPIDLVNLYRIARSLGLSKREEEVFLELVQDKKLKEIAEDLDLAVGTIKALCNRVYEKAEVKGKKELIRVILTGQ